MPNLPKRLLIVVASLVLFCVLIGVGVRFRRMRQVELNRQLQIALDASQENRIIYLLSRGAELRTCTINPNWPILFDALYADDTRLLRALLQAGDNPNIRVPGSTAEAVTEGVTPLLWFVGENEKTPDHFEKIKLLLDAGANPNARDSLGASVLQHAAGADSGQASTLANPRTIEFLLQHGSRLGRGDAPSVLATAMRARMTAQFREDQNRGSQLQQLCLKFPLPPKEREKMILAGTHVLKGFPASPRRSQFLADLRRELSATKNGPQHP